MTTEISVMYGSEKGNSSVDWAVYLFEVVGCGSETQLQLGKILLEQYTAVKLKDDRVGRLRRWGWLPFWKTDMKQC